MEKKNLFFQVFNEPDDITYIYLGKIDSKREMKTFYNKFYVFLIDKKFMFREQ